MLWSWRARQKYLKLREQYNKHILIIMTSHSRIIMRNIFRCRERHNLSWSMLVSGGQEKVNKKLVEVLLCRTETVGLSSRKGGTGAQDSHLNFYTAPEL